jgi:hypothetical protein
MAFRRPSLVVDTSNTSGTGSYTLINGDPGDGFRNLADAVADGDAANADTISYFVVDTTTKGATLAWEHGTGTISGGGTTLARTAIIESSNGDAAVNWGSGGTRTVRFGAGTAGFAQLAAAQTFTALQTMSAGLLTSAGLTVDNNFAGRITFRNSSIIRGGLYTTATPTMRLDYVDADGSTVSARLELGPGTVNAGVGTLQQGGTAVALQGVLSAPAGMRLLSLWTTVPTGWSVVASTADKTILTTVTAAEASTTGGSWTISGLSTTVDGHALTEAQIPAHWHPSSGSGFVQVGALGGSNVATAGGSAWEIGSTTGFAGGSLTHTHTASTTSGSAWRPAWIKALVIVKS